MDKIEIELNNVNFSYNNKTNVIKDINLKVVEGEFLGIIGKSGSGKSTLLKHLNGILRCDSGNVKVLDSEIKKESKNMNKLRRNIGIVFQFPEDQLFAESIKDDLEFAPIKFNLKKEEIVERTKLMQKIFNISDEMLSRSGTELSGGEKRRISIAGIAIYSPKILVLDEPTIGLDAHSKVELLKSLENLRKLGTTIVIVSHDLNTIWDSIERIVYMKNGSINFDGDKNSFIQYTRTLSRDLILLPNYIEFLEKKIPNNSVDYNSMKKSEILDYIAEAYIGGRDEK